MNLKLLLGKRRMGIRPTLECAIGKSHVLEIVRPQECAIGKSHVLARPVLGHLFVEFEEVFESFFIGLERAGAVALFDGKVVEAVSFA